MPNHTQSVNAARYYNGNMPYSYAAYEQKEIDENVRHAKLWLKGILISLIFGGGFIGLIQQLAQ